MMKSLNHRVDSGLPSPQSEETRRGRHRACGANGGGQRSACWGRGGQGSIPRQLANAQRVFGVTWVVRSFRGRSRCRQHRRLEGSQAYCGVVPRRPQFLRGQRRGQRPRGRPDAAEPRRGQGGFGQTGFGLLVVFRAGIFFRSCRFLAASSVRGCSSSTRVEAVVEAVLHSNALLLSPRRSRGKRSLLIESLWGFSAEVPFDKFACVLFKEMQSTEEYTTTIRITRICILVNTQTQQPRLRTPYPRDLVEWCSNLETGNREG